MPVHPGLWYDRGWLSVLVSCATVDSVLPGHGALFLQERIFGVIGGWHDSPSRQVVATLHR